MADDAITPVTRKVIEMTAASPGCHRAEARGMHVNMWPNIQTGIGAH